MKLAIIRHEAELFAEQNAVDLARDLLDWSSTSILPTEAKLRQLAHMLQEIEPRQALNLAKAFAERAILEQFVNACALLVRTREYVEAHSMHAPNPVPASTLLCDIDKLVNR